ncbi:hypothetical protein LY76DRAFT_232192 [Colletotrichum caudatum]|nr:hypothetical protein LY76DRAFT_232192 [Colletotrichum caudatum]
MVAARLRPRHSFIQTYTHILTHRARPSDLKSQMCHLVSGPWYNPQAAPPIRSAPPSSHAMAHITSQGFSSLGFQCLLPLYLVFPTHLFFFFFFWCLPAPFFLSAYTLFFTSQWPATFQLFGCHLSVCGVASFLFPASTLVL